MCIGNDFENRIAKAFEYVNAHSFIILDVTLNTTFGEGIQEALIERNLLIENTHRYVVERYNPVKVFKLFTHS